MTHAQMDRRGHVREAYEYCPLFSINVPYRELTQYEIEGWIWGGECDKDELPCTYVETLGGCPHGRMKKRRKKPVPVRKWPPNIPVYTNFVANILYALEHLED